MSPASRPRALRIQRRRMLRRPCPKHLRFRWHQIPQPDAAQSSSDHPLSESAPVPGAPASSPPVETSQKPLDPSQTASPQAVESSDHNRPAAENATAHDSLTSPFTPRDDDQQTAPPATAKRLARKRALESAATVEGFSRQDIPDLLSQADSSAA